jgi:hypothetical protein
MLKKVLYSAGEIGTYLILDRRADETIRPIDTVRGSSGEQCGSKDNCEITYRHRVLCFVLYDPDQKKNHLNVSATSRSDDRSHTCVDGPRSILRLRSWHPVDH